MSEPLLPDITDDERPVGWGDDQRWDDESGADPDRHHGHDERGSDEDRLRAARPPHHDRD